MSVLAFNNYSLLPTYIWIRKTAKQIYPVSPFLEMTELDGIKGMQKLDADIKMILNLGGNCLVNQHGDINRTKQILSDPAKVEFIVCSDLFLTSSAMFADILLPGVSMFESENMTVPWKYGNFIGYNNWVVEPLYEGRFEYGWLCEVADKLGLGEAFSEGRTAAGWLEKLYNDLRNEEPELPDFEVFKAAGIYRYQNNPTVVGFAAQRNDPKSNPFPTPSGKVEIFSEAVYRTHFQEFFPAIPRYVQPPEGTDDPLSGKYPLQLIGWHTKRRCHSIHDNNDALRRVDPQQLWMHPQDAAARNIRNGETVLVHNDRGAMRIPVKITEDLMPGVVALSEGAWYRPDENGIDQNGSINVLTSLRPTPYARGNAQHTNLVEVRKL